MSVVSSCVVDICILLYAQVYYSLFFTTTVYEQPRNSELQFKTLTLVHKMMMAKPMRPIEPRFVAEHEEEKLREDYRRLQIKKNQ